MATMEALKAELEEAKAQLVRETRRANNAIQELRHTKEQNLAVHKQVEQEEEFITNKLMKRLEQLKKEKQILANEVEQEEEFLTNTLQKRLEKVAREKEHMENQLEAEQEYIVNKLQTQVEALGREKSTMQTERMSLQKQVGRLTESVTKLSNEKVRLEQELESEEELIVNRMQRQIDDLLFNYKTLEKALRANGIFVPDSELIPMPYLAAQDRLTRWSPSFGRRGGPDFGGRWASRSLSASPARARAGSFSGGGSMQRRVSGEMGDRKSASAAGRLTTNKPTPSGAVPANTKN
mmetsp:Transcript_9143/g.23030  ORF Transcript_9143/g.23030 Transcript_9143/m.23030 type:complete len:294 (+) Transcript_9143:328-1209(+)